MLRLLTTAGLLLAFSQAAFAQAPPAPAVVPTPGHMATKKPMAGKHSMMMKKPMATKKPTMMHGSQMNGTTPAGAGPSHSP